MVDQVTGLRKDFLKGAQADLTNGLNMFTTIINKYVTNLRTLINNGSLVLSKIEDCDKTAKDKFDNVLVVNTGVEAAKCVNTLLSADNELNGLLTSYSANIVSSLQSAGKCVTDNKMTTSASINAASADVKASIATCLHDVSLNLFLMYLDLIKFVLSGFYQHSGRC